MVVRKIVEINEDLCNGCGNCVPNCAEGALQIVEGKAKIVKETYCDGLGACLGHCPQGAITIIERDAKAFDEKEVHEHLKKAQIPPTQKQTKPYWPVQLNLVPIESPNYQNAHLLIAADCVPVALPTFHNTLLPGKRVIIGCPKFDDAREYAEKIGEIIKRNKIASLTVVHMEVPCCSGLKWVVDKAVQISGKQIPVKQYIIKIGGEINEL